MRTRDRSFTKAELEVLLVAEAAGDEGAMLARVTSMDRLQVASRTAKSLARDGMLTIDAGASARLTDTARAAMRDG